MCVEHAGTWQQPREMVSMVTVRTIQVCESEHHSTEKSFQAGKQRMLVDIIVEAVFVA